MGKRRRRLLLVCLLPFFCVVCRAWAVNALVGLAAVGYVSFQYSAGAVSFGGGWLLWLVLISAVLCIAKGVVSLRG